MIQLKGMSELITDKFVDKRCKNVHHSGMVLPRVEPAVPLDTFVLRTVNYNNIKGDTLIHYTGESKLDTNTWIT